MNNESRPTLTSFTSFGVRGLLNVGSPIVLRIEQYVPAPLRCFKCQKFGHHREACRGRQTCSKCGKKDPDHAEEDCLKETRCANCQLDHPVYARTCTVYQKEKEIIEVKHKRNVSFLGARRIIGSYMGEFFFFF